MILCPACGHWPGALRESSITVCHCGFIAVTASWAYSKDSNGLEFDRDMSHAGYRSMTIRLRLEEPPAFVYSPKAPLEYVVHMMRSGSASAMLVGDGVPRAVRLRDIDVECAVRERTVLLVMRS